MLVIGMDGSKVLFEFSCLNVFDDEFFVFGFGLDELVFMQLDQLDILNDDSIVFLIVDVNVWIDYVVLVIKVCFVFDDFVSQV